MSAFKQVQFHEETLTHISKFFSMYKIPPVAVKSDSFRNLCQHLNPLVQLPKPGKLEPLVVTEGTSEEQPCLICGVDISNQRPPILHLMDALLYLTTDVLTNKKPIHEAKRNIMNETLVMCLDHKKPLYESMIQLIGYSDEMSFDALPDFRFLGGITVFNRLQMMWYTFFDKPYRHKKERDYRTLVKGWIIQHQPKKDRQQVDRLFWKTFNAEYKEYLNTSSPVEQDFSEQSYPADETEESASDEVLKDIKLEEPEYNEVKTEEPESNEFHREFLPSTSQLPTSSPKTPFSPSTIIPKNPTVYTLKNGKKVVKVPSELAALSGNGGKLVTYRVATRKVIKRPIEAIENQGNKEKTSL